jgi:hypothetical protein
VHCDEAIYELNRINEFRLTKKGDNPLEFECKLEGGEVLASAKWLDQMSEAEKAYVMVLNDIGNKMREIQLFFIL